MADLVTAGADPGTAQAVLVVLHGRTLSPDWMIEALVSRLDLTALHAVLPAAPGQSWYDAKAVEALTGEAEAQLRAALEHAAAAEAAAREACPGKPLILIGFSQGACLGLEHLMRGGKADAAALLTGCRVGAASDDLPRADLKGLPIYCTNSDDDPWIPTWAYLKAQGELIAAGARIRTDILPGRAHEISAHEVAAVNALCAAVAAGRAPFKEAA